MNNTILDARTVAIVRDLKVEQRQGANGTFESKDILVRIAVDRDYKVTRTENGKTISENPTDFWLAKFTGATAQAFADYCTAVKEDGKLHSRRLLLAGNFENYNKPRKVSKEVNINGALYNIEFEIADNNTIFVVDSMKFLDKAPTSNATPSGAVSVTPVAVAQPVAIAQPVAQPTVVTQPVPMPVGASAQPAVISTVEQVAQAMVTPVAQPVMAQPIATPIEAPAVPTVAPGFIPAGETAPF